MRLERQAEDVGDDRKRQAASQPGDDVRTQLDVEGIMMKDAQRRWVIEEVPEHPRAVLHQQQGILQTRPGSHRQYNEDEDE
jgi:hypothetical protein